MTDINEAKQSFQDKYFGKDGVVGVGVGQNLIGDPAIHVMVSHESALEHLPKEYQGYEVIGLVTGPIDAQPAL